MATAGVGSSVDQGRWSPVSNTLTRVATKRRTLIPQRRAPAASGAAGCSADDVSEGGGESVESGGEAGIYDSYVCVQPKLSARKGLGLPDLDHLEVEPGGREVGPQRAGVLGV